MKIYIVEGIDGSGKSTVSKSIRDLFLDKKILAFREPDGYSRKLLALAASGDEKSKMTSLDEWMCFWIGRFDLWMNQILPLVDEDVIVIIDRSFVSTYAYQISGRDLGPEFERSFFFWKNNLLNIFSGKEVTIQHIYMRASVKVAQKRIGGREVKVGDLTQFEAEDMQKRVKSGFDIYYHEPSNLSPFESVVVINADGTLDEVKAELRSKLVTV